MKPITGHLAARNKKWYAVINLYDENGKRHEKWNNLDLEERRGSKTEAARRLDEILKQYNSCDIYLMDNMTHAERERSRIANMPLEDYLTEWLEQHKSNVSGITGTTYKQILEGKIIPFFQPMRLKVKEVTGDEINDYYTSLRLQGLKGTTAQRHHALLHRAFKQAVKRRIITTNPCEQADRPKSEQYIGSYYNAEELKSLLDSLTGDPIRMVILLTAYYGLRRSEVLGIKWTAVDFTAKTISIRHKILKEETGRGIEIKGYDVMKTKSSYRTLPLIPLIEQELLAEKARQEEMKRLMRSAYSKKYEEYVCVDALGNLIAPAYVSDHFTVILKKNSFRKIRFHDLRHSCASLMLANGVPMKMIQDWLGHSDMATTANIPISTATANWPAPESSKRFWAAQTGKTPRQRQPAHNNFNSSRNRRKHNTIRMRQMKHLN